MKTMTKAEVLEVLDDAIGWAVQNCDPENQQTFLSLGDSISELYAELDRTVGLVNANAASAVIAMNELSKQSVGLVDENRALRAEVERLKRAAKELVDSLPDTRRLLIAREDMIRAYTGEPT